MKIIGEETKERKGTKRRSKDSDETLKGNEGIKEIDEEIINPPRRRSARLIATSKPNSINDASELAEGINEKSCSEKENLSLAKRTKKSSKVAKVTDVFGSASTSLHFPSLLTPIEPPFDLPSNEKIATNRSLTKRTCTTNIPKIQSLGEGTSQETISPSSDDDDGEDDEWGSMELLHPNKSDKKVIEVELDEKSSVLFKRLLNPMEEREAKEADEHAKWKHEIELEIMRKRREFQEGIHRFHFLTYASHLHFMVNSLRRNVSSFVMPFDIVFGPLAAPLTPAQMEQFLREFRNKFRCQSGTVPAKEPIKWCTNEAQFVRHLLALIDHGAFNTDREIALLFFALCSFVMHLRARLCVAFSTMPKMLNEPKTIAKKNEEMKRKKKQKGDEKPKKDGQFDEDRTNLKRRRGIVETKSEVKEASGGSAETAYWNEYWDDVERRWISVDPFHCLVDEPNQIENSFELSVDGMHKIIYVLAIDSERGIREIGAKYIGDFLSTATRKLRTDEEWIKGTMELAPFRADENRSRLEEAHIYEHLKSKPIPTVLAEFKNHPLYALKKDLLKFEAIYPPDTQPIGHIGKQRHEVFPRSAVHKLEGSLNWIKESRAIKANEKPYKVVAARPKLNVPKEKREPLTLDLFGYWQTEPYAPPEVTADGRIPRNEFGNLYMYKEDMLPKDCVHLRLSGIYHLARRMDLEAVPAVVGWEFSGGFNHPILDGCVVLRKDEEILRMAWAEMAREKAIKTAKKAAERVWKKWRRLIKGKMLLEQMRKRFNTTN